MSTETPVVAVNDEVDIPLLGFGTYLIDQADAAAAVTAAIQAGYRHIDTAEAYRNEEGVGAGIHQCMESRGLSRDDIFVTTKLWPGNAAWGQPVKTYETTLISPPEATTRMQQIDMTEGVKR